MKKDSSREFELKLELSEKACDRLLRSALLRDFADGPPQIQELTSTYFDTPDLALASAGASLRVRENGGRRVQTLKLGTGMRAGVSNPREFETEVDAQEPAIDAIGDPTARKQLLKLLNGTSVERVFETRINRTLHVFSRDGCVAECAVDRGRIVSDAGTQAITEVELELKQGKSDQLLGLAEDLFAGIPIAFSQSTKAQRGYRLVSGAASAVTDPVKSGPARVRKKNGTGEAFRRICISATEQILANWRITLINHDPEGPHQLRVGLRRLRTAVRLFRPVIDSAALRGLNADLRDVARIVGGLRDFDVIVADIAHPALAALGDDAGAAALKADLIAGCAKERRAVRRALRHPRWNSLRLRLAMLPHHVGLPEPGNVGPIADQAGALLQNCWKTARKRGRDIDRLSTDDRHRLRKDLKTLRYATEFFAPLLHDRKCRRFIKALKNLQDSLGYMNDVALAGTLPQKVGTAIAADAEAQRALGFVLGWHSACAEHEHADIAKQWAHLEKNAGFWL